ncbi:MAG: 4Fe-4S dicluster domain-containing protein [Halobacteriota archaeon]|jgi:formate hydrogenlyase subunit 6/NADH:ubiquinone oxidoreductase subunit I
MASGFFKDLIRSFTVGIVGKTATVRSASEVEVPAAYRGTPIIDPEKCILCGRCGKVCPAGAIALRTSAAEKSVRIFVGHCVFCSECAMICPVSAITMSKVWDTVVTDRLSRDTMSEREIKRRSKPKEKQVSSSVASESRESTPQAADPEQVPPAGNDPTTSR